MQFTFNLYINTTSGSKSETYIKLLSETFKEERISLNETESILRKVPGNYSFFVTLYTSSNEEDVIINKVFNTCPSNDFVGIGNLKFKPNE